MKITKVDVIPLSYMKDYPPIPRFFGLFRIETDAGHVGYGEASTSYGNFYPTIMKSIVDEALARVLIGKDPLDIHERLREMRLYLYPWLGWEGVTSAVIGAIEIALWDILGKESGKSIANLLGSQRKTIPLYCTGSTYPEMSPEWHGKFFDKALELGFIGVKTRIANGPQQNIEQIAAVRKFVGPDIRVMTDGYWCFSEKSAIWMAKRMADYDVFWFEEAMPQYRQKSFTRLRRESPVPIAVGERIFTLQGFQQVVDYEGADFLQPDVTICSGIYECLQVDALAKANDLIVYPHIGGITAVGMAANLHLAAVIDSDMLEYDFSPFQPLRDELLRDPIFALDRLVDGCIVVPDGPGLGIEVDESMFEKYPYKPGDIYPDVYPQLGAGEL
jgi:L-alanine-DL-glutamate epimerase-like enolase superfamily enzyme